MSAFSIFLLTCASSLLQSIIYNHLLYSRIGVLTLLSMSGAHSHFINMLAYDHAIELNASAGMYLSTLDR